MGLPVRGPIFDTSDICRDPGTRRLEPPHLNGEIQRATKHNVRGTERRTQRPTGYRCHRLHCGNTPLEVTPTHGLRLLILVIASILTNRPFNGLFVLVSRASTIGRLERLELITSRLKSDDSLVVADLAGEFGVSVRTLTRDLQILRNRGLPIDADRGRGGGVRMHWNWGIGRLALSYAEAVDLLVSLAVAERIKSPVLMANLGSVRRKLMASFSPLMRRKLDGLKSRIIVGASASPFVLSAFSVPNARVVERLHQAFLMMRKLHIHYRDATGEKSERGIEPQYLVLSYPVWYAIAWDDLRSEVRTFRCDRIDRARLLDEVFRLRRFAEVEKALEAIEAI